MTRLFIAEVAVPEGGDMKEARRAMDWMRCVLMNRLKHPSDFSADRHATQITQVISAQRTGIQFQGFQDYPLIEDLQQKNIDARVSSASSGNIETRTRYADFLRTAIAASTDPAPVDPSSTGLYFWVTSGTESPDRNAVPYDTLGGNTFYTWKRSHPHLHHANQLSGPLTPPRNGPLTYDHKRPAPR